MFDLTPQPPQPLQQSDAFAHALHHYGATVTREQGYLTLHRRVLGVRLRMVPRFACIDPALLLDGLGSGPVILSPDAPCPHLARHGVLKLAGPATTATLALDPDEYRMRSAMHSKWRNRLNHAERQGLRISMGPMPPDPGHWLLQADTRQARERGYRGWPVALTTAWARVAPEQTLLVQASDPTGPCAAMLFLMHAGGATYHVGHVTSAGRKVSAHNLLLWTAMTHLGAQGYSALDLGLLSPATSGLNRFKLASGAMAHSLGGTWLHWRVVRPGISLVNAIRGAVS